MAIVGGLIMVLTGLAILSFGLFLFYAWLPLLYAFVGLDIGLLLGRSLTGDVGAFAIVLGIAGAVVLGAASYFLEPYRRVLLGISGGVLLGFSIAAALNLDGLLGGFFTSLLALACGLLGGILVPRFFDAFVVGASAISGAAMAVTGAHHIFPRAALFDLAGGGPLPAVLTIILALIGIAWQGRNIANWVHAVSSHDTIIGGPRRDHPSRPAP